METAIFFLPRIPKLQTDLPGPKAAALIARDRAVTSPSYTRGAGLYD
jgi:4-aminobutyrate aminotransferase